MSSKEKVFINGDLSDATSAKISPFDRGFLFADGVYELIPFFSNKPFLLDEHYLRLSRSLQKMEIKNPYTEEEWKSHISNLVETTDLKNFYLYIQVTSGTPELNGVSRKRDHVYPEDYKSTVFMFLSEITLLSQDDISSGQEAITLEDMRWYLCDIKSISLAYNAYARDLANKKGAFESILKRDNLITEGSSSNIFIIKNNKIITPKSNNLILHGITRGFVFKLAKKMNIEILEKDITYEDLMNSDEVFVTNSTQSVVPISVIDGKKINSGSAGPLSLELSKNFISEYQ